jgi:DNA-binding transcriptional LysR family regulator
VRIEQLEYLAAVTRHGSLRRASDALHVSQPALSESLAKLERELGVTLLDRRRSGARISRQGRDLLPYMSEVLGAVDRLRQAAGDQNLMARSVRIGTVSAASSSVLLPAVQRFRRTHPGTTVEVVSLQHDELLERLTEASLDLGLVNVLDGDDLPAHLSSTELLTGRPVACLPSGHPLAAKAAVTTAELREHPFVAMRPGYLMHRFAQRLFGSRLPDGVCWTDGAELGKLMVAQGLGLTVLPDYSLADDPLCRSGLLTARPLEDDETVVRLLLLARDAGVSPVLRALQSSLVARSHQVLGSRILGAS